MIHQQLLSPHPLLPQLEPPHPPQQKNSRIMIHQQLFPPKTLLPSLHPHPQFVAVKSLMRNPPRKIIIYNVIVCGGKKSVKCFLKEDNRKFTCITSGFVRK